MVSICPVEEDECIEYAAETVSRGGVIIYPTDTVYGIGGDPFNISTVSRVLHLKKRVRRPFPILVSDTDYAFKLIYYNDVVGELARRYWPGALTIVSRARVYVPAALGHQSIGVRVPGLGRLRSLIDMAGGYLIGTSANVTGLSPARTVSEAVLYFGDSIDLYLDGGLANGSPSTVVEVGDGYIRVLRKGLLDTGLIRDLCMDMGLDYYE